MQYQHSLELIIESKQKFEKWDRCDLHHAEL